MSEYHADTYGNRHAAIYGAWLAPKVDSATQPAAAFLAELADDAAALEPGVGTGRVAWPLAALGKRVHGHQRRTCLGIRAGASLNTSGDEVKRSGR